MAGIVTDRDVIAIPPTYTLENGQTLAIDQQERPFIDKNGPAIGDLLLLGSDPSPWAASFPPKRGRDWPEGCFSSDRPSFNAGAWIEIEITVGFDKAYIRVPKAESWRSKGGAVGEAVAASGVCLDAQGRAFASYGSLGPY